MNELKPCPFCGKQPTVQRILRSKRMDIACTNPDCQMMNVETFEVSDEEATAAWNTRPIEDQQAAEIAALREQLAAMTALRDSETRWAAEYHNQAEALREQLEQARGALGEIDKLAVNRYDSPYSSLASISNIARAVLNPPEAA